MLGIKSRKLTQEQIDKAEELGNKVGRFLFKDGAVINRANRFMEKHRLVALPLIVVFVLVLTVIGVFLMPHHELSLELANLPTIVWPSKEVTASPNGYEELMYEYRQRIDSVQSLLDRGNLSKDDSVYIAASLKYIDPIKPE